MKIAIVWYNKSDIDVCDNCYESLRSFLPHSITDWCQVSKKEQEVLLKYVNNIKGGYDDANNAIILYQENKSDIPKTIQKCILECKKKEEQMVKYQRKLQEQQKLRQAKNKERRQRKQRKKLQQLKKKYDGE